jgi:hypothetical protein
MWHPVEQHHVRLLTHPPQDHPAGKQGADSIAIGPRVSGYQQVIGLGDGAENRVDR